MKEYLKDTTLRLTLNKKAFEVMVTGEKNREFRKPSKWIKSRLYDKKGNKRNYDHVVFINGYGNDKPIFVVEFKDFEVSKVNQTIRYSNDLDVYVEKGGFIINLGSVFFKTNLNTNQ